MGKKLQMKNFSILIIGLLLLLGGLSGFLQALQPKEIKITEGTYEGADHFIITTPSATYYYDQAGGGFSRLIDRAGNDWISFRCEPWDEYPASAASAFRGLPNFVFGSEDSGAGHPGHERCRSEQISDRSIRTTSKSGRWQWEWTFHDDYAEVTMLKTDPDHPYWFLYEGTPGGSFDPANQFWGTNNGGPTTETPDYYNGTRVFDSWQWAYFGHQDAAQVLVLAQQQEDDLSDSYSYLGNTEAGIRSPDGMVVFGFGRAEGAKPLLHEKHTFYVGLLDKSGEMGQWQSSEFPWE